MWISNTLFLITSVLRGGDVESSTGLFLLIVGMASERPNTPVVFGALALLFAWFVSAVLVLDLAASGEYSWLTAGCSAGS
jgi:hypothetical protein